MMNDLFRQYTPLQFAGRLIELIYWKITQYSYAVEKEINIIGSMDVEDAHEPKLSKSYAV